MTIRMKDKVDIYLANPEYFNDDLREQYDLWVRNVVRPLGSHYEASKTQIDTLAKIAEKRSRGNIASLARIDMYLGIVTAVLFFAVDLISAGAMSKFTILLRQRPTQSFDNILASSSSLKAAIRTFHSQTSSISDSIVANFDSSVRGLVSTSTVGATVNLLSTNIGQGIPSL